MDKIEKLIGLACEVGGVTREEISRSRRVRPCRMRTIFIYEARRAKCSFDEISEAIGGRGHSTSDSIKRYDKLFATDPVFRELAEEVAEEARSIEP